MCYCVRRRRALTTLTTDYHYYHRSIYVGHLRQHHHNNHPHCACIRDHHLNKHQCNHPNSNRHPSPIHRLRRLRLFQHHPHRQRRPARLQRLLQRLRPRAHHLIFPHPRSRRLLPAVPAIGNLHGICAAHRVRPMSDVLERAMRWEHELRAGVPDHWRNSAGEGV